MSAASMRTVSTTALSVRCSSGALRLTSTRRVPIRRKRRNSRMGESGARLARSYSWEHTGTKVERVVESILRRDTLPADLTQESVA